jgi:tetratricopeptide (TPR) repeat protein
VPRLAAPYHKNEGGPVMKVMRPVLGLWILWLGGGFSPLYPQAETVWTGRLMANSGNASYSLRIEIKALSKDSDLAKLSLYREAVSAKEFQAYFIGTGLGIVRIAGNGSQIVLPVNVVTKKKTKDGWRFLLVARNFPVEPGVTKISRYRGSSMAGIPISRPDAANALRQDRFVAAVLEVDENLSGQGRIYDDAEVRFTENDVQLVSSASRPRLITDLQIGEAAPGGGEGRAPRILARKGMTPSLQKAAQRIRAEEDTPAARSYPAEEMYRDMDAMNYQTAAEQIGKSAAAGPVPGRLIYALAYARYRLGQLEAARLILADLIKDNPEDLQAYVLLSCLQYQAGRLEEAAGTAAAFQEKFERYFADGANPSKEEMDLIKEIVPNAGLPAYLSGLRAIMKAEYPAAIKWLSRARTLGYDHTDCWIQRMYTEYKQGHWRDILWLGLQGTEFTEAALPQDAKIPSYTHRSRRDLDIPAEIWLMEGIALERLEKPQEAWFAFESAEQRKPYDPEILEQLAARYERSGRREAAEVLRRRQAALSKDPSGDGNGELPLSDGFLKERDVRYRYAFHTEEEKTAEQINRSALKMVGEGKNKEALERLISFAEIFERSPTIQYNIALLEKNLGRSGEALRWAMKAMELKDDYKEAYDLAGNVFHQLGDYGASIRFYTKALSIDKNDPLSHYNLGCAYAGFPDQVNAENSWRAAIREDKARRSASSEKRADETRIELDVDVEPVAAMAYRSLGFLYVEQGRKDEALGAFLSSIESNPSVPPPYFEVGKLLLEKKDEKGADGYFKKYVAIGGDEAKVRAWKTK